MSLKKIVDFSTDKKRILLLFLIIIGIASGFLLYKDYGASWDEPEYYEYANSIVHAYSLKDLVNGNYNLDSSLGHVDLRYYGPAYLLFGKILFSIFNAILPSSSEIEVWHLLNYLFFLLGILFFYKITSKLVNSISTLITTLLFATQPVLFGSSWINPKDIPFMVIFLGTIYFSIASINGLININTDKRIKDYSKDLGNRKHKSIISWLIAGILIVLSVLSLVFGSFLMNEISRSIQTIFLVGSNNIYRAVFSFFAQKATPENVELYVVKGVALFIQLRVGLISISIVYLCIKTIQHFFPGLLNGLWYYTKDLSSQTARLVFAQKFTIFLKFLMACLFLGALISTRVVGPFAGLLLVIYGFMKFKEKCIPYLFIYGILSILFTFALWPYLWIHPFKNFLSVLSHMADNPVVVNVLFNAKFYGSNSLPAAYLPTLLPVTLTEIIPFFFIIGLSITLIKLVKNRQESSNMLMMILAWFFIPFFYVILLKPPLYDNYRHFLFIVPPLFMVIAVGVEKLLSYFKSTTWKIVVGLGLLIPGIIGIISLHPYEYSYYNSYIGGIKGASGRFEIDYWNTCYKDLAEQINQLDQKPVKIIAASTPKLVSLYLKPQIDVEKMQEINYPPDSLILLHYRWEYLKLFPDYPTIISVKINGTPVCVGKLAQ